MSLPLGSAVAALVLGGAALAAHAEQPPRFSADGLDGWEAQSFRDPSTLRVHKLTDYAMVEDGGVKVLSAHCDDAGSAQGWRGTVDLRQTPMLRWRWKVDRVYPGLDERLRGGSDFPARVYVVAGKRWLPWTIKSLIYVWANGMQTAESWRSPYSGPAGEGIIVPVRSGADGVGQWQEQSRDVKADFKRFFGVDLDAVGAVAIATDCDDAHGQANAWYGDLHFEPR